MNWGRAIYDRTFDIIRGGELKAGDVITPLGLDHTGPHTVGPAGTAIFMNGLEF